MRSRPDTEQAILEAVREAWEDGCPVASCQDQIVELASRRLGSVDRRLDNSPTTTNISKDLARALIGKFETDATMVGPLKKDYEFLADRIVDAVFGSTSR